MPGDDFDWNDPIEVLAFYEIGIRCDRCNLWVEEEGLPAIYPDQGWVRGLADVAKRDGWQVVRLSEWDFSTLCPACRSTASGE